LVTEQEFNQWQKTANACLHATKFAGMPWSIRLQTRCPVTQEGLHVVVVGTDERMASALSALLHEPKVEASVRRLQQKLSPPTPRGPS